MAFEDGQRRVRRKHKGYVHIIGKDAYIRDVATSEKYRGRGFAADCVISLSRELKKSADCIFLMCKPDNAKLYEKCGFIKKEYIIRKT